MKGRILYVFIAPLLLSLLSLSIGCKKMETEVEETPATTTDSTSTSTEPSTPMGTDTMGTDMAGPSPHEATEADAFPKFPWPPPKSSARAIIPRQLLAGSRGATTLGDMDRRLTEALEQTGYLDSSYYAVPRGFALVTKMEQIKESGEPSEGNARWVTTRQPLRKFSLAEYMSALFGAAKGRYRVIAFIVTPLSFTQSDAAVTPKEASRWLNEGADQLPAPVGRLSFNDLKCTALIYEFSRVSDVADPELQVPSALSGRAHLERAGIWGRFAR